MKRVLLIASLIYSILNANSIDKLIGSSLMIGFFGTDIKPDSKICKEIRRYNLAGVILFDRDPVHRGRAKNIISPAQLDRLTKELKSCSPDGKLLIAIDQEGGVVQRLKSRYGFYGRYPKAIDISKKGKKEARRIYAKMADELSRYGVNYNLAPVVDLAINPKNRVIVKLGRSFSSNPKIVISYAKIFIEQMHRYGVVTSLKHFPGHGSSMGDTHKGFVDVTNQWRDIELEPYKYLINRGLADSIMVAHIFNKKLDSKYPASLSHNIVTKLLRNKLHFRGVVITDDLQMGAISKHYTLKDTIKLAINAGDDILLFGNQLDPSKIYSAKKLVSIIKELINEKQISISQLKRAKERVDRLKIRLDGDKYINMY